ncbi:MAG: tetratricopeptide repeat protein [Chitinophagaceae bacterium]
MCTRVLLLFALSNLCVCAKAQVTEIFEIQDTEKRLDFFCKWAYDNIYCEVKDNRGNRQAKLNYLNNVYQKAKDAGDEMLMREAWYDKELWKIGGSMEPFEPRNNSAEKMLQAAETARKQGWDYVEAQCRMTAASIYFSIAYYDPTFEQAKNAYKIIQTLGVEEYPQAALYIAELANFYFHFMEYDSTIRYMKQAINVRSPRNDIPESYKSLNTVGMSYRELNQLDSAIAYYLEAYENAQRSGDVFWMNKIHGNLGKAYFEAGNDSLALPLLIDDFENNIHSQMTSDAVNNAGELFSVYLKKNDFESAKKYFSYFKLKMDPLNIHDRAKLCGYFSDIALYKKDFKTASLYLDSSLYFQVIARRQHDKEIQQRNKQLVATEVYSSRIKVLESIHRRQTSIRNGLIGMIVFLMLIVLLYINRIRMKKGAAVKLAQVEKRIVMEKLKRSQVELNSFANRLKEKNEIIERFRSNIERLGTTASETERVSLVTQLNHASILTENDWQNFRVLFDKVYPGFFNRLQNIVPTLSPTDMRLMALAKLQIAQKDMAAMLGMGYDAVRKARQRLRAKMDTGNSGSIEELVMNI